MPKSVGKYSQSSQSRVHSIEVFDFSSAKWLFSIKGMNTPKGILYVPQVSKLFVVNIGDNTLKVLDDSYHVIKTLDIGREADYIRYDPGSKKIMVGYSESQMVGGMLLIDPITYERTALKLDAPPEDFAFDEGGHYIYANLHDLNAVDVVDRSTGSIKKMEIQNSGRPTPMALNEDDHRLFVVSRSPADLIVINTDTGKEVARISVGGISADLLFDSKAKRLYNVNGTGYVNVIQQLDPNHYELVENVPTAVGARSGFLVPQIQRLVVAVPTDGVRPAGLWEYQTNSASHAR